mmetsp:Transcript_108858/g.347507  ORF Transcript_108858/g.347507 Transcript_108858/m.347507 type:complete len:248 (+) Transcript_108858:909-1652(+)
MVVDLGPNVHCIARPAKRVRGPCRQGGHVDPLSRLHCKGRGGRRRCVSGRCLSGRSLIDLFFLLREQSLLADQKLSPDYVRLVRSNVLMAGGPATVGLAQVPELALVHLDQEALLSCGHGRVSLGMTRDMLVLALVVVVAMFPSTAALAILAHQIGFVLPAALPVLVLALLLGGRRPFRKGLLRLPMAGCRRRLRRGDRVFTRNIRTTVSVHELVDDVLLFLDLASEDEASPDHELKDRDGEGRGAR